MYIKSEIKLVCLTCEYVVVFTPNGLMCLNLRGERRDTVKMNKQVIKRIIGAVSLAAYSIIMSMYDESAVRLIPVTAIVALVSGGIIAPRVIDYIAE